MGAESLQNRCSGHAGGNRSLWAAQSAGRDLTPREMRRFIAHQIAEPGESVHGGPRRLEGNLTETKVTAAGVKCRVVCEITAWRLAS
jgi:hypothetical protein